MPWIEPVFDRTIADVNYARENRNDPQHLKGAINYSDWNRITGNVHYLADLLTEHGYNIVAACKTIWAPGEVPPAAEIQKIHNDLDSIETGYNKLMHSPPNPDAPWNQYQKINDVEQILFDTLYMFDLMARSFKPCGTFCSGQVFFLPRKV